MTSKKNCKMPVTFYQIATLAAIGLVSTSNSSTLVSGYTSPSTPFNDVLRGFKSGRNHHRRRFSLGMYIQGDAPSTATPQMAQGHIFSRQETRPDLSRIPEFDLVDGGGWYSTRYKTQNVEPPSPMAENTMIAGNRVPISHGLLSPYTVSFIAHVCVNEAIDCRSEGLNSFLETYHSAGPMACLHFLSDPHVLPILTKAMKEACHHAQSMH
mmetsp:Transcript_12099/g.26492  ORF Transcript_12099/g.26492 Transcript_12099/m.26492 type:complete len:211 (-) Transcript_12099:422-1054(-)